jgi:uncharacterized repeat protein (TIGR01451 family)
MIPYNNRMKDFLSSPALSSSWGRFKSCLVLIALLASGAQQEISAQVLPVIHNADSKSAAGSGTSLSVARPDNVVEGNLIILVFTQQRSSTDAAVSGFTVPSGFTLIRSQQDAGNVDRPEIAAYYKIATASEPANYTSTVTTFTNTPNWKAYAMRVTSFDPRAPVQVSNGANANSTSVTIPSITTTVNNSLLIAAMTAQGAITPTAGTPTGMTQIWYAAGLNSGSNAEPAFRGSSETRPTAGATGDRTFQWTTSLRASGLMFAVRAQPCALGTVTVTNPTCAGGPNGVIQVINQQFGSGTYEYRINGGAWQSSNTFSGLAPGTYTVEIRDANNTTCPETIGSFTLLASAVNFDAVSSQTFTANGTTTPITLSHTTGSGDNRLMLVGISTRQRTIGGLTQGDETEDVTYGGEPLIFVGSNIADDGITYIFMMVDPPSGTATLSVKNFNSTLASNNAAVIGVTTYSNVSRVNPIGTYTTSRGNSATPTITIPSTTINQTVFNVLSNNNSGLTVTDNSAQTLRWFSNSAQPTAAGNTKLASAGSTTLSYTVSASNKWSLSGVAINPVRISDLTIAKTADITVQNVGQKANFTITAQNLGCFDAPEVVVNDLLPSGFTYISHTQSTGDYNPEQGLWDLGTLAVNATATLEIEVVLNPMGDFTNVATISSSRVSDPDLTNNEASITITLCGAGAIKPLFGN